MLASPIEPQRRKEHKGIAKEKHYIPFAINHYSLSLKNPALPY